MRGQNPSMGVTADPSSGEWRRPPAFPSLCVSPFVNMLLLWSSCVCWFWGWDIWFLRQEENKRNMIIQSFLYYPPSQRRNPPLNCSILDFCGEKLEQQIEWQDLRDQQGWIGFHCKGRVLQVEEKSKVLGREGSGPGFEGRSFGFASFLGLHVLLSSWMLLACEHGGLLLAFNERRRGFSALYYWRVRGCQIRSSWVRAEQIFLLRREVDIILLNILLAPNFVVKLSHVHY